MFTADFANIAANVILLLLGVRLAQGYLAKDSTLASAIAYLFH